MEMTLSGFHNLESRRNNMLITPLVYPRISISLTVDAGWNIEKTCTLADSATPYNNKDIEGNDWSHDQNVPCRAARSHDFNFLHKPIVHSVAQ